MNFVGSRPGAAAENSGGMNMTTAYAAPAIPARSEGAQTAMPEPAYSTDPYPEDDDMAAEPAPSIPSNELRERASRLVHDFFAATSGTSEEALAFVARSFAPTVRHYGSVRTREDLIREHDQYMARWPVRSYRIEPQSLSVSCDQSGATCLVSGLVDFDCASPERGAVSRGVSSFSLRLAMRPEGAMITSDDGTVVRRL